MAAPRRIQQDRGGADTACPESVQVLQRSVTCRWEFPCQATRVSTYGLGMAILGWGGMQGWKGDAAFGHFHSKGMGV